MFEVDDDHFNNLNDVCQNDKVLPSHTEVPVKYVLFYKIREFNNFKQIKCLQQRINTERELFIKNSLKTESELQAKLLIRNL